MTAVPNGASIFPLTLITQPQQAEFFVDNLNQLLELIAAQAAPISNAGLITPNIGVATGTSLAVTAGLTSSGATGAGIGYATGAGGAVTQITNRTTGVTLSTLSGQITTNTASLAAEAAAAFTVTNTAVAIGDVIVVSQQSGSNGGNTDVTVTTVAAGSFQIKVSNNNAAAGTAETGAIIINYAVIKAVAA